MGADMNKIRAYSTLAERLKVSMNTKVTSLTPWFPAETKPVRVGVYKVQHPFPVIDAYAYWAGRRWTWTALTIDAAYRFRAFRTKEQNHRWRGLSADPSAKKGASDEQ
jgi:hypothetical protein